MYILDTETASLYGGVCEIAWLRVDSELNILDEFVTRVNPERPIEPGAQAVHGISDEDVKDSPTLAEVAKLVPPSSTIVGHNISFDLRMVKPHIVPGKALCTLALARQYVKDVTNHKLESLQKELNLPVQTAHSARGDVLACRDLLLHILSIAGVTLETLIERASKPKMVTKMLFGKHKGVPMLKVPREYRNWLLTQPIDDNLRYTLKQLENL